MKNSKVTPAMIEAGARVIWNALMHDPLMGPSLAEELAEEAYKAMEAAKHEVLLIILRESYGNPFKKSKNTAERAADIFLRWQEVHNCAEVGREVGLTRERVNQIVKRVKRTVERSSSNLDAR